MDLGSDGREGSKGADTRVDAARPVVARLEALDERVVFAEDFYQLFSAEI